jgi:hypothetical protein
MATVTKARAVRRVSVTVNPQKQTIDQVNQLVKLALGRAGCDRCGRIAYLDFGFLGDPGPDFNKFGAISVDVQEG